MYSKPTLKHLKPYAQGKQTDEIKTAYNLERVVKLSSNENPYGYSEKVKELFASYVPDFNVYPDGYATKLRQTITDKLQINESQIVFGSGADEMIQTICRAFLSPEVNTVMAKPTFTQYKQGAVIEGATVKEIPTQNGYHDLDKMLQAIDDETSVVWICSPDNPTGTYLERERLLAFLDQCPNNVLVVLDEAYYEFVSEANTYDTLSLLESYENLILLRTFSKAYGLAGLRIGYGLMHESIATKLNIVRGPFNTTTMAQDMATIAFQDEQFIADVISQNQYVKDNFQLFLDDIGWSYYDTETNFILVKTPISGTDVFEYLIQNGFIVRPGEMLGYPDTVRITIGLESEMEELKKCLYKLHVQINKEV